MDILNYSALELRDLLDKKELSSRMVVSAYIKRIEALEPKLNSYVTLNFEEALKEADRADQMIKDKNASLLTGIPISLKDNISTKGLKTTCGSQMLKDYIPPFDATVVRKIKEAGMPILGKTNMDEFAMGSSTETSFFGPTKNPWNRDCVPGGSSGGSAASVAAKEAPFSLGTDTGGSVRQPAALTGIAGLKPTYGQISRYGVIPLAGSLDQVGPLARTVADLAALFSLISGHDYLDSASSEKSGGDFVSGLGKDLKGLKVGIWDEHFGAGLASDAKAAAERALKALKELGAEIVNIELPYSKGALEAYYVISASESSSSLGRFDGVRYGYRSENVKDSVTMFKHTRGEGFGSEVKRRILLGTYFLSAGNYEKYYLKACKVRRLIKENFDEAFKKADLILTPASPTPAFKLGSKIEDQKAMHLADIYTTTANLAGIPALSMPAGLSQGGLPLGVQLLGPAFGEKVLLNAAFSLERALESIGFATLEVE